MAPEPLLELDVGPPEGGSAVVRVSGECDLSVAETLHHALLEAAEGAERVYLDLRKLRFLDSAGVFVLCAAQRRLAEDGSRLVLVSPSEPVSRVLELLRIGDQLEIVESIL